MKRLVVGIGVVLAIMLWLVLRPQGTEPPEATPPRTPEAATSDCLELSAEALRGLQAGMQTDYTVSDTAALPSTNSEGWFVVATIAGPGMGQGEDGIWFTANDPTGPAENAYVSVTGMAAEFSNYAQPNGYSNSTPGVEAVTNCSR